MYNERRTTSQTSKMTIHTKEKIEQKRVKDKCHFCARCRHCTDIFGNVFANDFQAQYLAIDRYRKYDTFFDDEMTMMM